MSKIKTIIENEGILYKSPLKWAGGKYKLLTEIYGFFPEKDKFIDVFAGSAVISRNCNAKKIIVNDINSDLYNFYYWLKHDSKTLIKISQSYFNIKYCSQNSYLEIRNIFNSLPKNNIKRAALFLVLNKFGFNGICRYNKEGIFNVPVGSSIKSGKIPGYPLKELKDYAAFFEKYNVKLTKKDFRAIFPSLNNSNIYCDPPYLPLSVTASFTDYSKEGFTPQDHIDLAECAFLASKNNNTIIISNHDTLEARKIYKKADTIIDISVNRSIAAQGNKRGYVKEILAIYGENNGRR